MSVIVIAPPAPLLTVPDAKMMAPALADAEDVLVEALLYAAQASIEPPISPIGRAMGEQTLELILDEFDACPTYLPWPPLVSVVSVKYDDAGGVEQTFDADSYQVWGLHSPAPYIKLASGSSWPTTSGAPDAVRIRYTAGYDPADPALYLVKQALVLTASNLLTLSESDLALRSEDVDGVGSQQWAVSDVAQNLIERTIDRLLGRLRIITL